MLFFSEGFTFRNFLADAFAVFMFVLGSGCSSSS
jgi:hypothetical protein